MLQNRDMLQDEDVLADNDSIINDRLKQTVAEVVRVDFFSTLTALGTVALALLLVGAVFDQWIFRHGLTVSGRLLFSLISLFLLGGLFLFRMFPLLRYKLNPLYAAQILESNTLDNKNIFINWLLLKKNSLQNKNGVSPLPSFVLEGVSQQAAEEIQKLPQEMIVDHSPIIRWGIRFIVVFSCFLVYMVFSPKSTMTSVQRISMPLIKMAAPQSVRFITIKPGNAPVFQGDIQTIDAEISGVGSRQVSLIWSTRDQRLVQQILPFQQKEGQFYTLQFPDSPKGLTESVNYQIVVGNPQTSENRSELFTLEVKPTPAFHVEQVVLVYPDYTQLQTRTQDNSGDIQAIEGTVITVNAVATIPIRKALFLPGGEEKLARSMTLLQDDPQRAKFTFTLPTQEQKTDTLAFPYVNSYKMYCVDNNNNQNRNDNSYKIDIIRDKAPLIRWDKVPNGRIELPENQKLKFTVRTEDPDFGLASVQLKIAPRDIPAADAVDVEKKTLTIELLKEDRKHQRGEILLPGTILPSELKLLPNIEMEYWVEVTDTKPVHPNTAQTEKKLFIVTAPSSNSIPEEEKANQNESNQSNNESNQSNNESGDNQQNNQQENNSSQNNNNSNNQDQKNGNSDSPDKNNQENEGKPDKNSQEGQEEQTNNGQGNQSEGQGQGASSDQNKGSNNKKQDDNQKQNQGAGSENQEGSSQNSNNSENNQNNTPGSQKQEDNTNQNNQSDQNNSEHGQSGENAQNNNSSNSDDSNSEGNNSNDNPSEKTNDKTSGQSKQSDEANAEGNGTPIDPEANPGDAFEKILEHREKHQGQSSGKDESQTDSIKKEEKSPDKSNQSPKSGTDDSRQQSPDEQKESNDITNKKTTEPREKTGEKTTIPQEMPENFRNGPTPPDAEKQKADKVDELPPNLPRNQGDVDPNTNTFMTKNSNQSNRGEKEVSDKASVVQDPDNPTPGTQVSEEDTQNKRERKTDKPEELGDNFKVEKTDNIDNTDKKGNKKTSKKDESSNLPNLDPNQIPSDARSGDPSSPTLNLSSDNNPSKGKSGDSGASGPEGNRKEDSSMMNGAGGSGHGEYKEGEKALSADDPQLRYTEQATSFALEYIEEQLKDGPDKELLKSLGWTEAQLKQFLEKWKKMSAEAKKAGIKTKEHVNYLEILHNLNLREYSKDSVHQGNKDLNEKVNATPDMESARYRPPEKFRERFRVYHQGISEN